MICLSTTFACNGNFPHFPVSPGEEEEEDDDGDDDASALSARLDHLRTRHSSLQREMKALEREMAALEASSSGHDGKAKREDEELSAKCVVCLGTPPRKVSKMSIRTYYKLCFFCWCSVTRSSLDSLFLCLPNVTLTLPT